MTTRRGFIRGVFASVLALVIPRAAAAMPINEPDTITAVHVPPPLLDNEGLWVQLGETTEEREHGIAIGGVDSCTWPSPFEDVQVFHSSIGWEPQFMIATEALAERSKPTTFASPFTSPLAVPYSSKREQEVPDEH